MKGELERTATEPGAALRTARKVVLVVDDDPAVRDTVALSLRLEGYVVRTAENGLDALLALRTESRTDAIVLDLEMPVMTGWELRTAQLGDPALAAIPVLVLSASARAISADRRMPKPLALDELVRAVRELAGPP